MNHIEEKIIQTIDEHRDEIIAFAKDIQSHPEPGFYEERTAAHVAAFLRGLGLRVHGGLARTGVRAEWMEQDGRTLRLSENLTPSDVSRIRWLIPPTGQHMHADTTHRLQP